MFQNSDMVLNDIDKDSLDLSFHSSGIDQCKKGNIYGPRIRRYHLIHFVLSGQGTLQIDERKYPVKPGQAFYIPAGCQAVYQADLYTPWKYCWLGYQGTLAHHYSRLLFPGSYVADIADLSLCEHRIMELLSCTDSRVDPECVFTPEDFPVSFFSDARTLSQHLRLNGILKVMFADLVERQHSDYENIESACYADKIKAYMEKHYHEHLQIQDIADHLGLSPHYVTAVFKNKFHLTPKRFLTTLRIDKAKTLLADTKYSLQVIANAVGLENPFSFSRLFKSVVGISPAEYRRLSM